MNPVSAVNTKLEALAVKLVKLGRKYGDWDALYVAGAFMGVAMDLWLQIAKKRNPNATFAELRKENDEFFARMLQGELGRSAFAGEAEALAQEPEPGGWGQPGEMAPHVVVEHMHKMNTATSSGEWKSAFADYARDLIARESTAPQLLAEVVGALLAQAVEAARMSPTQLATAHDQAVERGPQVDAKRYADAIEELNRTRVELAALRTQLAPTS